MPIEPSEVNRINFENKMKKIEDQLNNAMTHFNERESESVSLILELEKKVQRYEKALKDIMINCDSPSFRVVAKMALEGR